MAQVLDSVKGVLRVLQKTVKPTLQRAVDALRAPRLSTTQEWYDFRTFGCLDASWSTALCAILDLSTKRAGGSCVGSATRDKLLYKVQRAVSDVDAAFDRCSELGISLAPKADAGRKRLKV